MTSTRVITAWQLSRTPACQCFLSTKRANSTRHQSTHNYSSIQLQTTRLTPQVDLAFHRHCHAESDKPRSRPRFDRIGYQHEDTLEEIKQKFDFNFCKNEFFRGAAQTFLKVTNCINDDNEDELEPLLSKGAQQYAQWVRDEATHSDSCYTEVIFPVEERDIFSLVVNNVEVNSDGGHNKESHVDITVTVTYGKKHRVIFGIPDSYSCSFAIFRFQRTFLGRTPNDDWMLDRIQYYPPR